VELIGLIASGTPFLVLGMLVFLERINTKVSAIREDVQEIKEGITWSDTCNAKHAEINRRLAHMEKIVLDEA